MTKAVCDVLVVDDDAIVLVLVERRLRDSGLSLKTCDCGSAALDYLSESRVRLLLVDYFMKPMNGLDLLETIDSRGLRGSASTFLSTSARPLATDQKRLDKLGCAVLKKAEMLAAGGIARLLDEAD